MTTDNKIINNIPNDVDEAIEVLDDGSVAVDLSEPMDETSLSPEANYKTGHYVNLVDQIHEDDLFDIGQDVAKAVEEDEASRSDWMKNLDMGLDLTGIKLEEKNSPFKGACSAHHPLMLESAVKFQSKASAELLPANGPVEVKILGEHSTEREEHAIRVKKHMNYQVTEEMTEFYTDTEKLLLYVALIGSGFKKTYYDGQLERPVSEFVPADQFIVPNNASDLERAPRYTHKLYMTKNELNQQFANEFFVKPENLPDPKEPEITDVQRKTNQLEGIEINLGDEDKVYTLYEQHTYLHIPEFDDREGSEEFELASPYIVTVDATSKAVIGLRRNWREGDEKRKKLMKFTHFGFVPGFGFYHYGFLQLLGNLQLSLTSSLRALVDAGQFSNLQGGFKLKGVRIVDDGDPIAPGQFKEVEAGVQDISKAIMRLPFGEPSQTLYQMLEFLDRKGQKFADSTEQVIADSSNYGPVGTTLALLDASTKFFSAIHKRLHNSQKQELKIIAQINSETLKQDNKYSKYNPSKAVTRKDYDERVDVVPVSDPNISSNAHRMTKAQAILDIALKTPEQHNMREVLKHVYTNFNYDNVDTLLPPPEEAQESDPLTDIQTAISGKPIQAFPGQDHQSHITIKQAFLQDPLSGGSELMRASQPAVQANIQEHMLMQFQESMGAIAGEGIENPEIQAQAAQQIAQQNQAQLEAQMQQQQANDDKTDEAAMLLAQAEAENALTEKKKQEFDAELAAARLELDKEKLELDKMKEVSKLVAVDTKIAADMQKLVTTKSLDTMIEGLRALTDEQQGESKEDSKEEAKEPSKEPSKE
jgi:hypothetical protein